MKQKQKAKEHELFKIRQCQGKRRITSRRFARYVAQRMSTKNKAPFRAYKCEVCGFYHVGHEKTPFRMFMMTQNRQELRA